MNKRLTEINNFQKSFSKKKRTSSFLRKNVFFVVRFFSKLLFNSVELSVTLMFLLLFSIPILIILTVRKIIFRKDIFENIHIFGKDGRPLVIGYFNVKKYYLKNCALFLYIFTGKLSLVGVGLRNYERKNRVLEDSYLFNNKPGIFSLYYIRKSSKITHETKAETEWEYIFKKNLFTDLMLILKSIPAAFYHVSMEQYNDKINLFDLHFLNVTMENAVELIKMTIQQNKKKMICFVNPDCLNKIFSDKEYFDILNTADHVFPDGIGIHIACKMISNPLLENVNGTDMLPFICKMLTKKKYSMFLLGGKQGITEKMKKNLEEKYNGINIAGHHHGYFDRDSENEEIIEKINKSGANILLVAFGVPLQEKWIANNLENLQTNVILGVGGLFDFYSGNIPRAPKWMREVGLEWTYRLMQEPRRMWRRYIIGNPLFIYRVIKWKLYNALRS
ncbi:MAG: WecB/TagA/CpsF family glycosyltransferase [Verrucomicrobiota bacterium]|nr:WecB/TagA/CpsF family glycosyltransferase [Verrucomicrobiota bacterium]